MKKIVNSIVVAMFTIFAVTTVSAQRSEHRASGSNAHAGRGGSVAYAHSNGYNRGNVAYNRGNAYNTNNRGGAYNRGNMAYNRGGAYYGGRGVVGGRRPFVSWAAAHRYGYGRPVYFPAYHLYYDPFRCGYTYWYGGRWMFSAGLPGFLAGIDLAAAQIQYLTGGIPVAANYPTDAYYGDSYYGGDGYYPSTPVAPMSAVAPVGLNIHIGLGF